MTGRKGVIQVGRGHRSEGWGTGRKGELQVGREVQVEREGYRSGRRGTGQEGEVNVGREPYNSGESGTRNHFVL